MKSYSAYSEELDVVLTVGVTSCLIISYIIIIFVVIHIKKALAVAKNEMSARTKNAHKEIIIVYREFIFVRHQN